MFEAIACCRVESFCGKELVTLTDASSSIDANVPTAFPTFNFTGVREAFARSIDEPDSTQQAMPDPASVTEPWITSALLGLNLALLLADEMVTMGADGASIITVTEAVANLLLSNTTTVNKDVVPAAFATALSLTADADQAVDIAGNAQVEVNLGTDWEHDQA